MSQTIPSGSGITRPAGEVMCKEVDRCDWCSGALVPGKTTLQFWRGEQLVVIRDVPADICQQCREPYLSAALSKKLDHFLLEEGTQSPARYLTVPEYSAAQALGS